MRVRCSLHIKPFEQKCGILQVEIICQIMLGTMLDFYPFLLL